MVIAINEQTGVNGVINSEQELREYIEFQSEHVRGMAKDVGNPNWIISPSFITDTHTVGFRFGENYSVEQMMEIITAQVPFESMRVFRWDDGNADAWSGDDLIFTNIVEDEEVRWMQILTPELCDWSRSALQGVDLPDDDQYVFHEQIGYVTLRLGKNGEL